MSETESLVKIHVELPNHWATGGESMWALPLGENRYQIRNTPFYAYNLNFLDIVIAASGNEDLKPEILSVVERSGHQTIRVFFSAEIPQSNRIRLLESLNTLHTFFEQLSDSFFTLDIQPECDYLGVRSILDKWNSQDILDYETCEAKFAGSFDSLPEAEESSR
ncbi:DUF4265 domain-containing protein [Deinococcus radiomollis]|uniref:DUF4265 domain-containing protein n=1 Tax=Deinococcus radiomollis TaxID=468916 RepID=UPI0038923042